MQLQPGFFARAVLRATVFLALFSALLSLPTPLLATGRHALLIGISDYSGSGLHDLKGAVRDIDLVASVLKERYGFSADAIVDLKDAEASHQAIAKAFDELVGRVAPDDFVYIHYSGHGSLAPDLNGDEVRTGQDQTWVSHGSRSGATGIDQFDVLDDQINAWLGELSERAGQVVFVSDSCHSATTTRGEGPVSRAGPPASDAAEHPRARAAYPAHDLRKVITIGAARDDQSAYEFTLNAQSHGVFTWNWVRALRQARPGESWAQIFERARVGVQRLKPTNQRPQISGRGAGDAALGGPVVSPGDLVAVKDVNSDGTAVLAVGRLEGVAPGAVYRTPDEQSQVTVTIQDVASSWSRGLIEGGKLAPGDLLLESQRAYETQPLLVYVTSDEGPRSQALAAPLRTLFPFSGYERTEARSDADLLVYAIQPRRTGEGDLVYGKSGAGTEKLPALDSEAPPEVWVLTAGEDLLHERFRIDFRDRDRGMDVLRANLRIYRNLRWLEQLATESAGSGDLHLELVQFDRCRPNEAECFELSANDQWYKRSTQATPDVFLGMHSKPWVAGDLVSFVLENRGVRERHAYIMHLSPDGCVSRIFPRLDQPLDVARIKPDERLDLAEMHESALLLDEAGEEGLLLLVTDSEINPVYLEQGCYRTRGKGDRPPASPLERLLLAGAEGTRTNVSVSPTSWGARMAKFQVTGPAVP